MTDPVLKPWEKRATKPAPSGGKPWERRTAKPSDAPTGEAPQYAANGVPMNAAAKAEIIAKAKAGTLEVSPSRAKTAAAFDNVAEVNIKNAPTQFGTFMGNLAPGVLFGFADEIGAGIDAALTDRTYADSVEMLRGRDQEMAAAFPKTAVAGQVAGAVTSPASAFLVPAKGATLTGSVVRAAGSGATGGAIYGAGTGEGGFLNRSQNALAGAFGGALIGGAIPVAGKFSRDAVEGVANSRAVKSAIAAAPSMDDLRAAAGRIYDQADQVTNLPRADFAAQAGGVLDDAARSGMDDMLTPGAARVAGKMDDAAQSADPNIGFRELDILRKQAGIPAGNGKVNPTEATIGSKMIDGIDDFIESVDPALSGAVAEARSMWGQFRRSDTLDRAIDRAKLAASGFENGLRNEFRTILKDQKAVRGFNAAEIDAMRQVVQGTKVGNLMRQLGKIGLGMNGQSNGFGAAMGGIAGTAAGGPLVGAGLVAASTAMKALAERSTRNAARGALGMVSSRNALAGLPQASRPGIENGLSAGLRAILPQSSVPVGNALTGR